MEKLVTKALTIERKEIFDKNMKKRFELTFESKGNKEKKSILVIGLNPASTDINIIDTTTSFILNNLLPMGYTTITICNLYAELYHKRLKPSDVQSNLDNLKYMDEILKRGFDKILVGYGNTFTSNKTVKEQKKKLKKLLESHKEKVVDIIDKEGKYSYLKATHPLMAGRYFCNRWELRPFDFSEEAGKEQSISKSTLERKEENRNETDYQNSDSEPVVLIEANQ